MNVNDMNCYGCSSNALYLCGRGTYVSILAGTPAIQIPCNSFVYHTINRC
jgi:hypothetical protein